MSFSYREERRGQRVLDILTNDDAGVRMAVSRLGAELVSLARMRGDEWVGYLHRDNDITPPTAGWANHATVMGYFLHRLKDGRSLYRGTEIAGGTHSFLRGKEWHFNGSDAVNGVLSYEIRQEDFTSTEYPLNVSLVLSYTFVGESIRVTFRFQNHDPELAAHVGFGMHPGFALTASAPPSFRMRAGTYRRYFSPTNYLSAETQTFYFAGGQMPFEREKLPGSFILELVDVPERNFLFTDAPSGRAIDFDLTEVPYLTLWSDGGAFLCVEPCWGLTDHDVQRAFENKEGIQVIAAGGILQKSFTMTPLLNLAQNA
ncbi:MAG: hypothetical protein ACR2NX_13050 [Chthoniobacterales bacterium]